MFGNTQGSKYGLSVIIVCALILGHCHLRSRAVHFSDDPIAETDQADPNDTGPQAQHQRESLNHLQGLTGTEP